MPSPCSLAWCQHFWPWGTRYLFVVAFCHLLILIFYAICFYAVLGCEAAIVSQLIILLYLVEIGDYLVNRLQKACHWFVELIKLAEPEIHDAVLHFFNSLPSAAPSSPAKAIKWQQASLERGTYNCTLKWAEQSQWRLLPFFLHELRKVKKYLGFPFKKAIQLSRKRRSNSLVWNEAVKSSSM